MSLIENWTYIDFINKSNDVELEKLHELCSKESIDKYFENLLNKSYKDLTTNSSFRFIIKILEEQYQNYSIFEDKYVRFINIITHSILKFYNNNELIIISIINKNDNKNIIYKIDLIEGYVYKSFNKYLNSSSIEFNAYNCYINYLANFFE